MQIINDKQKMGYFLKKLVLIVIILGSGYFFLSGNDIIVHSNPDVVIKKKILTGSTFSLIASEAGMATDSAMAILKSSKPVYNLSTITAGKDIVFVYDKNSNVLKKLIYEIDRDEKLVVSNVAITAELEQWKAERVPIEYTIKVDRASGVIESSLYETIVDQNLDERLALALAETFAWQIDFVSDIQKGDHFTVLYEKKYREGAYSHLGNILAAKFYNNGEQFQTFYFESDNTKAGHYDENGNSVQKELLKAPLQYRYISSGFSYRRLTPILNRYMPHRAIDFAAPRGTPVVSVGDGTVVTAGRNGYYGIMARIRHNEMYTTTYGHLSSLARGVRSGARVKQGQIIGYVGSTGLSTGPHLHYELSRFGRLVNPFKEKVPPGDPVNIKDRKMFKAIKVKYQERLKD